MRQSKLLIIIAFTFFALLGGMKSFAAEIKADPLMQGILNHYLNIQEKLASDTTAGIEGEAQGIIRKISSSLTKPCTPKETNCGTLQKISMAASKMKGEDIQSLRQTFVELSQALLEYRNQSKPNWPNVFFFHCSMANNNKGAPWLQRGNVVKNPYFGKTMETCGTTL